MKKDLDIIETAFAKLAFGETQPSFESPEFASLMAAIKSLSSDEYRRVGEVALVILLDRMKAGMGAERTLKIMRGGDMRLS